MNKSSANGRQEETQMSVRLGLGKKIEAKFDGDLVCSDGGMLLLRKADEGLDLAESAALCVRDWRTGATRHSIVSLLRQRIYGIAAGYEDCNDATQLRFDAMHGLALGYAPEESRGLASQPTLSRFENKVDVVGLQALQRLLVHLYVRTQKRAPKVIRLSMDTTCDEVHGYQQLTFHNGFYGTDCYIPLFIFADNGFPLCAKLRSGRAAPGEDGLKMLSEVVEALRLAWPGVRIELTADSAFSLPELFEYCEENEVTYFIATRSHHGIAYRADELIERCRKRYEELGYEAVPFKQYTTKAEEKERKLRWRQREERIRFASKEEGRMQEHFERGWAVRAFCEYKYQCRDWTKQRRHIVRCEYTEQGPDTRVIITNASGNKASRLYEDKYCRRARCENWIKELKNYLKCDRTSCQEFTANQFRLLLHTLAFVLILEIKNKSGMVTATAETIRLRLLKIGVVVKELSHKVTLRLSRTATHQWEFQQAWSRL